jgi:hypothetical protein
MQSQTINRHTEKTHRTLRISTAMACTSRLLSLSKTYALLRLGVCILQKIQVHLYANIEQISCVLIILTLY